MICDHRHFIFVHNPKCAGSAIKEYLKSFSFDIKYNDWHYTIVELACRCLDQKEYFKFGFCRNPYDRFVSAFVYNMNNLKDIHNYYWKSYPQSYEIMKKYLTDDIIQGFRTFVKSKDAEKIFSRGWPIHFMPQVHFLGGHSYVKMDFIGRYESLSTEFNIALTRMGLNTTGSSTLNHINVSNNIPYKEFYDKESQMVILSKYRDDFKFFKYYEEELC